MNLLQLDINLIRRANASSNAFSMGDNIAEKYVRDISDINAMLHMNDEEKEVAIKKLHGLRTKELETRSRALGAYTYGPARTNQTRDNKNFDMAAQAAAEADGYKISLRDAEQKHISRRRNNALVDAIRAADAKGLKEVIVDDKKWYKGRKNWTTTPPK